MKRIIEGVERGQSTLFPERLEDWIGEDNPVRVIGIFVDALDLGGLRFGRVEPRVTGRPGYHPSDLLKLYIYDYLNRVQSSCRLEREVGRNVEVMWLTGRLSRRKNASKSKPGPRTNNGAGKRPSGNEGRKRPDGKPSRRPARRSMRLLSQIPSDDFKWEFQTSTRQHPD